MGSACNDGFACTTDTQCNSNGECTGRLNDDACDDQLFCNGTERCEPSDSGADAAGCLGGDPPVAPEDGIECTISTCDEVADTVQQAPSETCECMVPGELCDDDTPADCTALRCSDDLVCVSEPRASGTLCDDGFSCTTGDTCDSATTCAGQPDDDGCDDGLFCNGPGSVIPASPVSTAPAVFQGQYRSSTTAWPAPSTAVAK